MPVGGRPSRLQSQEPELGRPPLARRGRQVVRMG
nr:MAG TPA: hypothetical protein [Caudoviricetes sp.]